MNLFWATAWLLVIATGLLAAALLAATAILLVRGFSASETLVRRRDDLLHLCLLLILGIGLMRLMSWPVLLGFLESMVDQVQGAMCAYGVARLQADLIEGLHWKKALVLTGAGAWVAIFAGLRTSREGHARTMRLLAGNGIVLVLLGFEAKDEIAWLTGRWIAGVDVSCCTTVVDLGTTTTSGSAGSGGIAGASSLGPLVALVMASLIVGGVLARSRRPLREPTFWILAAANLAVTMPLIPLGLEGLTSAIGPRILGLPFHRCLYELLCRTPDFAIIVALGAMAPATALGSFLTALARLPAGRGGVPSRLASIGTLALAGASVMVAVHLIVHRALDG